MTSPLYFDHNATTPIEPYLRECLGNPSSNQFFGQWAYDGVEQVRVQIAALIGTKESSQYIFPILLALSSIFGVAAPVT